MGMYAHLHPRNGVEYCVCGNVVSDGYLADMTSSPCRCKEPGPGPSRLRNMVVTVKKTWDDFENELVTQNRYGAHLIKKRNEKRRNQGDFYEHEIGPNGKITKASAEQGHNAFLYGASRKASELQ